MRRGKALSSDGSHPTTVVPVGGGQGGLRRQQRSGEGRRGPQRTCRRVVNTEQASKRRELTLQGKAADERTTRAPTVSAGVVRHADEGSSNTGSPVGHTSTGTPRGAGRAGRVAERPGNAGGGKGPQARKGATREKGSEMPDNRLHAREPGSCRSEGTRLKGRGCRGVNRLGDGLENENRRKAGDAPAAGRLPAWEHCQVFRVRSA